MNRPLTWRRHPLGSAWATIRDSRLLPVGMVVFVAVAAGYLGAANRPLVVVGLIGISFALAMFAGLGRQLPKLFLAAVVVVLTGYAFIGRGFAHVGVAPLYVGEMLFGLGLLAVLVTPLRIRFHLTEWLIIAFIAWGALNTFPYLPRYGVDALRDGVFWGYSLFALAISMFIVRRSQFDKAISVYVAILPVFLLWVPVFRIALAIGLPFPSVPVSDVFFFTFKAGDMGVHMAGAAAFLLMGLYTGRERRGFPETLLWAIWLATFVLVASFSRGGMLAAGTGVVLAAALRPTRRLLPVAGVGAFLLVVALLINPTINLGGSRSVSVDQIVVNAVSIVSDTDSRRAESTKEWRLEWWGEIYDYTVRGQYFLTGKGFGINLAEDDGFDVVDGLRSPHNGHLTALARAGVPGFALWMGMHLVFGFAMLRVHLRARRTGEEFWAGIFGWVLVYWAAAMVNGAFDVYLEGPQGAIWMWVMMGIGLAALRIHTNEEVQTRSNSRLATADSPPHAARRPMRTSG
ncbi:MAG: O-antigen ligase domain-containing protein [Dehalococcoidia bacterium]|nr:O-antigen ligase domain-containing protein [Dehalococcoidia bacterium]